MNQPNPSPAASPIWQIATTDFPQNGHRQIGDQHFHWSIRLLWRVTETGVRMVRAGLWIVDPDTGAIPDAVILTPIAEAGTDAGPERRLLPNAARNDVLRAKKIAPALHERARNCGFHGPEEVAAPAYTISVETGGIRHDLGRVTLGPATVLQGRDGWLFLTGDTNDSTGQFCNAFEPTSEWRNGWRSYFDGIDRLAKNLPGLRNLTMLIAPSKETLLADRYPLPRARGAMIDVFLESFAQNPRLFWPGPALAQERDYAFDRVETHWTDFGARRTCEALLKSWGIEITSLPSTYRLEEGRGDLGDKVAPAIKTLRPVAAWPNAARLVFDNFALHHGNIRIWSHAAAPRAETVVIFGGSSAEYMVRYLSAIFRRVVSVYSAGSPDAEILRHEQPAHVILQTSQRFLTRPAALSVDSFAAAAEKIAAGHLTTRAPHAQELEQWRDEPEASFYFSRTAVVGQGNSR